jgi:hypothetical protein
MKNAFLSLVVLSHIILVGINNPPAQVVVVGGEGNPPLILCQWQTPDDGDPSHGEAGTQLLPSGKFQVDKDIFFWAVVTDPEGVGSIASVYGDVFHPQGPPEFGSFKYQLALELIPKEESGPPYPEGSLPPLPIEDIKAIVQQAHADGLISLGVNPDAEPTGTLYTIEEVLHQLEQCLADLYYGRQVMSYHQPAGEYQTGIYAFDGANNESEWLWNSFDYVATTACEFDFNTIDYGSVEVCTNKWVGGDDVFVSDDGKPTVRNVGNTDTMIIVAQDDMGLGMTDGEYNIEYDARLGPVGGNPHVVYDPTDLLTTPVSMTTIPGILKLCNTDKLDFSLHVKKAASGDYTGRMTIGCTYAPFQD